MVEFVVVFITAPDEEAAARMADELISAKLAACVTLVRNVRSFYRWKGKTEDETEVLMMAKTRKELFEPLRQRIKELHSYTVPEIIALPILCGSEEYLDWLRDETGV
ncbi:MAG: divalent-cation tolerance protein CutA [Nitrospirae bacterium]|nr:MAG: divalent-cation tolerance protein CutA [Nitrospirota bacterium]